MKVSILDVQCHYLDGPCHVAIARFAFVVGALIAYDASNGDFEHVVVAVVVQPADREEGQ